MIVVFRSAFFILIISALAYFFSATHSHSTHLTHFSFLANQNLLLPDQQPDIDGWHFFVSSANHYRYGLSENEKYEGGSSLFIANQVRVKGSYAIFNQRIAVTDFQGATIKLSGYIKTNQVNEHASFVLSFLDKKGMIIRTVVKDHNHFTGTQDWQQHTLTAKVPNNASLIVIGGQLLGAGQAWFDKFELEKVDNSYEDMSSEYVLPSQDNEPENPEKQRYMDIVGYLKAPSPTLELGAQPTGTSDWWSSEHLKGDYTLFIDEANHYQNKPTLSLKSSTQNQTEYNADIFGVFLRRFILPETTQPSIKFKAKIKQQYVSTMATIWLRIEDKEGQNTQFNNLRFKGKPGSEDWQEMEVILPIDDTAHTVSFGALLIGHGQVWIAEPELEFTDEVNYDDGNIFQKPNNLRFE